MQFDGTLDASTSEPPLQAATLTHRYLWGSAVDQILADEAVTTAGQAGNTLWTLTDHQNTVRDVVQYDNGTHITTVTNHLVYGSFGKLIVGTNPVLLGYTARPFDIATGEQWNLFRWYEAMTQRWLAEDPIVFQSRDTNLYRYCTNDPVRYSDPTGLIPPGFDSYSPGIGASRTRLSPSHSRWNLVWRRGGA